MPWYMNRVRSRKDISCALPDSPAKLNFLLVLYSQSIRIHPFYSLRTVVSRGSIQALHQTPDSEWHSWWVGRGFPRLPSFISPLLWLSTIAVICASSIDFFSQAQRRVCSRGLKETVLKGLEIACMASANVFYTYSPEVGVLTLFISRN